MVTLEFLSSPVLPLLQTVLLLFELGDMLLCPGPVVVHVMHVPLLDLDHQQRSLVYVLVPMFLLCL
jgi:hypothetical protein